MSVENARARPPDEPVADGCDEDDEGAKRHS